MIMAVSKEQIQEDIMEALKGNLEIKTQPVTEKAFKKEGTDNLDDFVESIASDMALGTSGQLEQAMASGNYFPTVLDPTIYDNGVLYRRTPALTYLETRNRRRPANSTEHKFIKLTAGFTEEWIAETGNTTGTGEATTAPGTASMRYVALPVSMSDIIGKGASGSSRAQLMEYAQVALREGFNKVVVAGDATTTPTQFDGLDEIAEDSGTRVDLANTEITLEDLFNGEAIMTETLKSTPSFLLTGASVLNQIKKDMVPTLRNERVDVTAGVRVPAYASNAMDIPIISDPNVPAVAAQRRLNFIDELYVFIADFMTPFWVPAGKTKPFASDGWYAQVAVQYHTAPAKNVQIHNIA
jgi:hypothetical protein